MDLYQWLELTSVLCNLLFLLLLIPQKVWAWPMGILGSLLGIVLLVHAKLYSEAFLYLFYVIIGIYGWISWYRPGEEGPLRITERKGGFHLRWILFCGVAAFFLGWFFSRNTDAEKPYFDATTTIFSFFASFLEARKILSSWIYWFVINAVSIWLYTVRGLEFYPYLAAFYAIMCIIGFIRWKESREKESKELLHSSSNPIYREGNQA